MFDKYSAMYRIGAGKFAEVFYAKNETGNPVALKKFKKKFFRNEIISEDRLNPPVE